MAWLRRIGLLILFVAVIVAIVETARESKENGDLPRFAVVSEAVYRGGQPTALGFRFLRQTGIKTIINLRA